MNGQNQNPNQNQEPSKADRTQPNIPPPPSGGPEAKIRTFESDVKSVQESGGGVPEPQVIKPEELGIGGAPATPPPVTPSPSSPSPVVPPIASTSPPPPVIKGRKKKGWVWWSVVIIAVVVVIVLGWWVYSAYFSTSLEDVLPETIPPVDGEAGIVPPPPPINGDESLPIISGEEASVVDVDGYKVVSILASLQGVADSLVTDGQIKEVALTVAGQSAELSLYLTTLLPELERTNLAAVLDTEFQNSFSILLYRQNGQVWPVYIAHRKAGALVDEVELLDQLSAIEETSVGNLYLTPPMGSVEFKTGPVGGSYSSRYASFDNKPASFNYGLFGDYLILATTYQGLTKAIELLEL